MNGAVPENSTAVLSRASTRPVNLTSVGSSSE